MHKSLLALTPALLLLAGLSYGQVALVHVTSCGPATFPGTNCAIPATASGNLIVVGWQAGGGVATSTTISQVTDSMGNKYSEAGSAKSFDAAAGSMVDIWFANNSVAGATTLTVTPSSTVSNAGVTIWEFSGVVNGTNPLEAVSTLNSQSANGSPTGAAVNTSGASDVVISLGAVSGNVTGIASGNPFADDSTLKGNGWAHLVTTAAGTYAPTWIQSPTGTYASSTVAFLGTTHSASLSWAASTSNNLQGYNVYRGAVPGGPYTKVNASVVTDTSYIDGSAQAGQTYYYVATAVDVNDDESAYSNQVKAVVPTP